MAIGEMQSCAHQGLAGQQAAPLDRVLSACQHYYKPVVRI
jgi:hypothetical protein